MKESEKRYLIIAFILITVFTALAVVLANIGILGETVRGSEFAKWGMGAVLGEIVISTVALFKFEFLSQTEFWFNLEFPDSSVNFSEKKNGTYEIISNKETIDSGDVLLVFEQGGWIWKLPVKITPDYTIIMNLVDDNKKVWTVKDRPTITVNPRIKSIRSDNQ